MTRIWIQSDRHLGMGQTYMMPDVPEHDVMIDAGDLADGDTSIDMLANSRIFGDRPKVFVAGNHEYYGRTPMELVEQRMTEAAAGTNVHFLNPGTVVIGDTRFIGATLWTDYELFGDAEKAMLDAANGMNDHRLILAAPDNRVRRFSPYHARERHRRERAYIEAALATPFDGATVVVTHHLPSISSVPDRFALDDLTPAFASDLQDLILTYQPSLWIHGHTHDSFDYCIGETRIICNPHGYDHERNRDYDPQLVVDVQPRPAPAPGP
jgi:hypothetical protein